MGVEFTLHERSALYGLLAENSSDIIFKSDGRGFIINASPAIEQLGFRIPAMLIGPHIRDLVPPQFAGAIEAAHRAAIAGRGDGRWIEFPAASEDRDRHWFEIQMRGLQDAVGEPYGVLCIMRSISERKSLEERLFAAEMTDPLTRLTNRVAFISMLDYMILGETAGCLALFDLDHFMTLNMRYGQTAGDRMLCAFADLLRSLARREDIISRIGNERFGLLLPGLSQEAATEVCQPIVEALEGLGRLSLADDFSVTTSAGLAPIVRSLDRTIKAAEIALFLAKAKGRSRVESSGGNQQMQSCCG
jgi:diguanylate cyclase (GGDEF)-like protein/PAS domain S-box-containing protein